MKIKFISDLHTEFMNYNKIPKLLDMYIPPSPEDAETTLCLAGDTGTYKEYPSTLKPALAHLSKRFKHVMAVAGNHELYGSLGVWGKEDEVWKNKKLPKNVHWLNNHFFPVDDVIFIGTTLWTDFYKSNPVAMLHAQRSMTDFISIKLGYRVSEGPYVVSHTSRLTPEETVRAHNEALAFLHTTLRTFQGLKCVIITHHAPSPESIQPIYRGDRLNAAYASDLSELVLQHQPVIWHHGHMHHTGRYRIGETEVICNALGYHPDQRNKNFDPNLVVEA